MTNSQLYTSLDQLAAENGTKQAHLARIQAELDSLRDGITQMPTTYADVQTATQALDPTHPQRIKWDELKAEFLALQATVNAGVTPTPAT